MVAVSRYCYTGLFASLNKRRASFYRDLLAIDCELDFGWPPRASGEGSI